MAVSLLIGANSAKAGVWQNAQYSASQDTATIEHLLFLSNSAIEVKNYGLALHQAENALSKSLAAQYQNGIIQSQLLLSSVYRRQQQYARALDYYLAALQEARKVEDKELLLDVYVGITQLYKDWEVFQKALDYSRLALPLAAGNSEAELAIQNDIAYCYYRLNDFDNAIKNYLPVLEMTRAKGSSIHLVTVLKHLQDAYIVTNQYDHALKYNLEIVDVKKALSDSTGIANSLNNIGALYKHLGQYEEALKFFSESLKMNRKLKKVNQPEESEKTILMNIGVIYAEMGQYKKSTQHYLEALQVWRDYAPPADLAEIYYNMAANYLLLKNYKTALLHSEAAMAYASEDHDLRRIALLYKQMSEIHRQNEDDSKALFYYQQYATVNDELMKFQNQKQEEFMQRQFEIEKREGDLKLLMAEKQMKDLEVRKLALETEKKENDIELLLREKELQNVRLLNQETEKEKAQQQLALAEQKHETELKDQEIAMLVYQDSIKDMRLRQIQLEEKERQRNIEYLEQVKANQQLKIEDQKILQRFYGGTLLLFVVILFLILRGYYLNRKTTSQLAKQNKEIQLQKDQLEEAIGQLKATQSQLVQSEKMASLGQLTAGIAHEINNPINFVYAGVDGLKASVDRLMQVLNKYGEIENENTRKGQAKLLREAQTIKRDIYFEKTKESLLKVINAVKEGASRTVEIVNGLRNFSRMDETVLKFANIHEGIDDTLVILKSQVSRSNIQITREYDESLPEIKCFPGQLNQVFMNIIGNAIQAIEGDGEITISTKNLRDIIKISIKDSGVGMPEEVKDKIFEPFFTTKDAGEGTGLGLSISYGIIQNHKGKLMAYSEVGKGSEFVMFLPKYDTSSDQQRSA